MHKPSLLVIDALNLIRRIFAVEQKQHTSDDALIIACKARTFNATQRLLKVKPFNYACAVLDGRNSWRYDYYPEYKANRQPMPELLVQHLDSVCEGFTKAGVFVYLPHSDEADDIIATLVSKADLAGVHSVIVSTDKGFLTLLQEAIEVFDYFQSVYLNDEFVISKYHVSQSQLIDYLALVGDKTNNIPGAKGVGKLSAVELLKQFPNVEQALKSHELSTKIKTKIVDDIDNYILSRALLSLRTDISLGIKLKDIRISTSLVAES